MSEKLTIFTVGHSTQEIRSFLRLLSMNQISAVADVRSSPYSKHAPQFNKEALKASLNDVGIAYSFVGDQLGARTNDDACYVGDTVSYERLSHTEPFRKGIERVEDGGARFNLALMCSERDPTECHRTILVSKVLAERGAEVKHILGNGSVESHRDTMLRVLDILGMPRVDMFHSEDELISQAYEGREKQIAYRRVRK